MSTRTELGVWSTVAQPSFPGTGAVTSSNSSQNRSQSPLSHPVETTVAHSVSTNHPEDMCIGLVTRACLTSWVDTSGNLIAPAPTLPHPLHLPGQSSLVASLKWSLMFNLRCIVFLPVNTWGMLAAGSLIRAPAMSQAQS
jgi:hypothetical protein